MQGLANESAEMFDAVASDKNNFRDNIGKKKERTKKEKEKEISWKNIVLYSESDATDWFSGNEREKCG